MAFRNEIIKDAPTAISSSANDFGYSLMQFLKCCKVNFQKKIHQSLRRNLELAIILAQVK